MRLPLAWLLSSLASISFTIPSLGADAPAHREMAIAHAGLQLPVRTGAPKQRVKLSVEGRTVREFEIELAEDKADFWVYTDLGPRAIASRGKTLRIDVDRLPEGSKGLERIEQGEGIPDAASIYHEAARPQFHFTSRRGWLNDPNGLVWDRGRYHLFYQHNPYGWAWGNMHWGHATSPDLVHWTEWPDALSPREFGDWCFSGSAVVDRANTSGFQRGQHAPLVIAYTSTGRGECIASSNDGGSSFVEYEGNPVVKHAGRDPRLLWYAPAGHWVMAVYDETAGKQSIAFHTSPDLKRWTQRSKIDGFFECPDLFELPVEGSAGESRWVLHAADGKYVLGDFDGQAFHATSGKEKLQVWYGNFYAAQSFSHVPDGRRIQIGWGRDITFPGMPFNQQMTVPVRLALRRAEDALRVFAEPVAELSSLRAAKHEWSEIMLAPSSNPLRDVQGELFDIEAEFEPAGAKVFGLELRGTRLVYDVARREVSCKDVKAPLEPVDGRIRLRILVDRGSIEVFGNHGRIAMSVAAPADPKNHTLAAFSEGGTISVPSLVVYELNSAWTQH
jgi:fructan beta-fructosidase